jgi:phosphohistidine phosphatase
LTVIIYMRHAKSGYPPGVADHDRPLSDRGRRNAGVARTWFIDHDIHIDVALVSTANRTRQTWEILDPEHTWPVQFLPELYLASAGAIEHLVHDEERDVLVLAHNPGIHEAAMQAAQVDIARFPTSAFAIVHDGILRDFVVPR